MKFRKFFVSLFIVLGVTFSSTVVAPVAFADRADAYTTSGCYDSIRTNVGTLTTSRWRTCYFNYTLWEESWFGGSHKDGWYSWRLGVVTA